MRLDKYIMNALQVSRNDAKKIIKKKLIYINGKIEVSSDYNVSDSDLVSYISGEEKKDLNYKENIYIMMNKPKDYVCATIDNLHKTVLELLYGYDVSKLSIVGRLDKDTEGLLLITTDGAFLHRLTSPKYEKEKTYYVECDGVFLEEDIDKFKEGIVIIDEDRNEYKCKSSQLKIIDSHSGLISIKEGKFHQIKKMCKATNKTVTYLKRISIGSLKLDENLALGEYRELTNEELDLLK